MKLKFSPPEKTCCSKCHARPCVQFSSLCEKHYRERHAYWSPIAKRGAQTRRERYPERYAPAGTDLFWQSYALRMVQAAKQRGLLPDLDGTIACVDCGGKAKHYEHRDYGRPLDVEPVCARCNKRRGPAKFPTPECFNFAKVGTDDQRAA